MDLSVLDRILWAAGFAGNTVLLFVLLSRKRWKSFPVFTAWIGFNSLRTVALFFIYRYGSDRSYTSAYWSASCIDLAVQLGIIFEIARNVLKPGGLWIQDAKKMFSLLAVVGAAVAAVIAYFIKPTFTIPIGFWIEKGNLFSSMLIVELVVSMMFASSYLGLVKNNHVMRIGEGLAAWAAVALLSEGGYSHFVGRWQGKALDYFRTFTYLFVTIYWIISLWRPEPERRTLAPNMQAYLDNLHQQLQSELTSIRKIEKH
ncbi:hypothetical protein [Acidobacterium sp. S8]|uniref:hypothetical protein n=1 Tax=Acidobacterium sp. S8 TaxID=1641854 RepID=UPI00131BC5E9|nr:hypothetical protein [Acidobacterium sp. S8]